MRAEISSRIVSATRALVAVLVALILTACKTEKDPDPATVLGNPPETAYLGVEYYYNFGAYGAEDILDYSLTNAPNWLALEDTSNKARQGVIMRGVPGLTGGNREEEDLGTTRSINLLTTDGRASGVQPFDITVKYNPVIVEGASFVEGGDPDVPAELEEGQCEIPRLDRNGEHTFEYNVYDDDGNVVDVESATVATRPVLMKVSLGQPSVTEVKIAFELESRFDPLACDENFSPPHQRCDHGLINNGDAVVGQDIVALGSESLELLDIPDYLVYQQNEDGVYDSGVVTIKPGITECFVRLEVVEDTFPEPSELVEFKLTEVRAGLAGLGDLNTGLSRNLVLQDNEPVVAFETVNGGQRDTLNVGERREFKAVLEGKRTEDFSMRFYAIGDSPVLGTEFVVQNEIGEDLYEDIEELTFPQGVDELSFWVYVPETGYTNPGLNDRFISLGVDSRYQAGRQYYARQADQPLRISLNELDSPVILNSGDGFVATDLAVMQAGRIFVVGYDEAESDQVLVKIFARTGELLQIVDIANPGTGFDKDNGPVLGVVERKVSEGNIRVDRFEFVVAFTTSSDVAGETSLGGRDVFVAKYWYDSATNGGEYVQRWTVRTGTDGDDIVQSAGLSRLNGNVVIAGKTDGTWEGQTSVGGFDSFVQRIDAERDGNDEIASLSPAKQVGSVGDDDVAGVITTNNLPLVLGTGRGSVGGAEVIGGSDAFFYTSAGLDGELAVYQVGSEEDEQISGGELVGSRVWLVGNSAGSYEMVEVEDGPDTLERTPLNSSAGFLLGTSRTGQVLEAFTLNDEDDIASDELVGVIVFDNDLVVAGKTDGAFEEGSEVTGEHGIVARVSLVDSPEGEPPVFQNNWRRQEAEISFVRDLANYRDDEVTLLTNVEGAWMVLLLSPEGQLLTQLPQPAP